MVSMLNSIGLHRTTFITYEASSETVDAALIAKYIDDALHLHTVVVVASQRHDNSKDAAFKICRGSNARDEIDFMEKLGYSSGPPRSCEQFKIRDQQRVSVIICSPSK